MRMDRVKTTAVLTLVACSSLIGLVSGYQVSSTTDAPRSQWQYGVALIAAEARIEKQALAQARQMFSRTGRMDRQDIRYGEHRPQIIAEQDIAPQAQVTQASMR